MTKEKDINVIVTMPFPEELVAKLEFVSARLDVQVIKAQEVEDISKGSWTNVEVLYTNVVVPSPEIVPNLKWIQFHWAGINHVADEPLLHQHELAVTTLSGANATQMGEYILMMMLALGHNLPDMIDHQHRKEWPKDRWERFSPLELRESTIGIVGYGSIGRQTARLLNPFGAKVLATKRDAREPSDGGYTIEGFGDPYGDYVHRLYPTQALGSMVQECDFLIITVPLTRETRNLIDAEILAAMKPSSYLVDASRGGIVDHDALIEALREKRLGGAALDVFPNEPLPKSSPLWEFPNVIISPHIAGDTPYYDERAVALFAENLKRYIEGGPLLNQFKAQSGY
jgi:phosphoglycerate dehydrogenase-like enzyme